MNLTEEQLKKAREEFARSGGKARAKKLSEERRKEIAQMGVEARRKKRENESPAEQATG